MTGDQGLPAAAHTGLPNGSRACARAPVYTMAHACRWFRPALHWDGQEDNLMGAGVGWGAGCAKGWEGGKDGGGLSGWSRLYFSKVGRWRLRRWCAGSG